MDTHEKAKAFVLLQCQSYRYDAFQRYRQDLIQSKLPSVRVREAGGRRLKYPAFSGKMHFPLRFFDVYSTVSWAIVPARAQINAAQALSSGVWR